TFTFWSVVPPQSVFAGVTELRPGYVRTYTEDGVSEEPFYEVRFPAAGSDVKQFSGTFEEAVEAVRAALTRATSLRLARADGPVARCVCGRLDSPRAASPGLRAKGEKFRTFSPRFEAAEYDETKFQREMSDSITPAHAEVVVSRAAIARAFPRVIAH